MTRAALPLRRKGRKLACPPCFGDGLARPLPALRVPCGDDHPEAPAGELSRDLEPDPPVGPGDEGDGSFRGPSSVLDPDGEHLGVHELRVGATPHAGIQRVDGRYLLGRQGKVKDLEVLRNSLWPH